MSTRVMSDGGGPDDLLVTLSVFGIVVGLSLWVGLFILLGVSELPAAGVDALIIGAWVLLPASVATHGVVEPQCSKRRVVLYSLLSAVPLLGVIPASVYLGLMKQ